MGGGGGYGGYPQGGAAGYGYGQPQGFQGGFVPRGAQQFQPQQQQQQQQQPKQANTTSTLPPKQSFKPPPTSSGPPKVMSLSIGGSSAAKPAPAKTMSISIGGKKVQDASKKDAPAAAKEEKPAGSNKVVSIGGGAAKKATDEASKEAKASTEAPSKAEAKSTPAAAATKANAEPEDWDAGETTPTKTETAAAATTTASTPTKKTESKAESKANFTREASSNNADAIAKEAARVADEDMLKELYGGEEADPNVKPHLNVVFIGHVDAGKSTMGGQLLYLTDMVDKRTMEKYEKEAKELGRESWYLSWALDSDPKERAKGKTVEAGRAYFETNARRYTILDAPGHKNFVPAMISSSSQADLAVLVISARKGEFETGFEKGGQTREHALLVKNNGIKKLVVVVNKMDTADWEEARYNEIEGKLSPYLKMVGFNPKTDVTFIPVSAQVAQNMKDKIDPKIAPWYKGTSLLEHLDSFPIEDRQVNAPAMLPIAEKYNELGTMVVGKLEAGRVKKGDSLLMMPNKTPVEVAGVFDESAEELNGALCGDNIRLRLRGINDEDISPGFVLTSAIRPIKVATQFEAQLAIVDSKNIIAPGYSCILHLHTLSEEITLTSLISYFDKKTGRRSKK